MTQRHLLNSEKADHAQEAEEEADVANAMLMQAFFHSVYLAAGAVQDA